MGKTDECKIPGFFNRPNDLILYYARMRWLTRCKITRIEYALPFGISKIFRYFREAVPPAEISLPHEVPGILYIVCQGDSCVLRPSEAHM